MSAASSDSAVLPAPVLAERLRPIAAPIEAPTEVLAAPPQPTALTRPSPGILGSLGWSVVFILVCQVVPAFIGGMVCAVVGVPFTDYLFPALLGGQVLGVALAVFLLQRRLGWRWLSELGLNRLPLVPALLAILCVPGLKVLCAGVAILTQVLLGRQDQIVAVVESAAALPWWLALLVLAVGPALNEELWFRGFLGRGLVGRYGPTVGIILASLFFGLVHLSPIQSLYAVVLGVGAHLIYRATRSLWVPILVHFLFNAHALAHVALFGGVNSEAIGTTEMVVGGLIVSVSLAVLALAGWGLYRLRARVVETIN